jgi:hypothetical protein
MARSHWDKELWSLSFATGDLQSEKPYRHRSREAAEIVVALEPQSPRGYLALYRLNMDLAHVARADKMLERFQEAAADMKEASKRDPGRAEYHYLRADALIQAGADHVEALREARLAADLDEKAPRTFRKLTTAQRKQVQEWLAEQETVR